MKKLMLIPLVIVVLFLTSCQKQNNMPVPEGPVSSAQISEALAACEMRTDLLIEENEWDQYPGMSSTSFGLRPPENERLLCFSLLSHTMGEDRSLGITVIDLDWREGFTEKECMQAIRFATILFGDFSDEMQVYEAFDKKYDHSEKFLWEATLEGINCQIIYNPEDTLPLRIVFATDTDIFSTPQQ